MPMVKTEDMAPVQRCPWDCFQKGKGAPASATSPFPVRREVVQGWDRAFFSAGKLSEKFSVFHKVIPCIPAVPPT